MFTGDLSQKLVTVFEKYISDILKEVDKDMKAQTTSLNAAQEYMKKTQHGAVEDK